MITRLNVNSEFARNVFTLMTGTAFAQVIPIAIMPILTRIWQPQDFGILANYMAYVAVLGVVVTGRLDMALLLARKNEDAIRIMIVALLMAVVIVMAIYPVIMIFDLFVLEDGFQFHSWHYFIPLGALLYATYALMIAWHNRNKNYKLMSRSRIIQSSSISFSQIVTGLLNKVSYGLVYSDLFGRMLSIILIAKDTSLFKYNFKMTFVKKIALLKRYRKFPLLEAPASLINVMAHQLPFIVIPILFSAEVAGMYFLVFRVLMMPASLIGTAVLEVFKNQVQEEFKNTGGCRLVFIKIGGVLFLIGLIPALSLIIFAPDLFALVFGEDWRRAGEFAQILAPLALVQFISSPLSYVLIFREKLFLDLMLQVMFLALVIVSLFVAFEEMSMHVAVWLLMASGVLFYLMQILFSYRHSMGDR